MKKTPLNKSLSWKCLFFTSILFCICWHTYSQQDSLFLYELQISQKNNSTKLLDSIVCYNPDSSPRWREIYTYNAQGLCTEMLSQDFTTYTYWVNTAIIKFMNYNQNGLCTEELYQTFDSNGVPKDYSRYKYFYSDFAMDSVICQKKYLHVDTLRNDYKRTYSYNERNFLTKESYCSWRDNTQSWNYLKTDTFLYNARGLLSEITSKIYKYIYTYDDDNLLTEVMRQQINVYADTCTNDSLFLYTYNEDGYVVELEYKLWDRTSKEWINYKKYICEYSDDYLKLTQTLFIWYPFEGLFKCLNVLVVEYDIDGNKLKNYSIRCNGDKSIYYVYYYSDFVGIKQDNIAVIHNVRVYPNPSNNQLKIETEDAIIKEVMIYDLMGKQIKHFNINDSKTTLNISDLSKGFYFIHIQTHQGVTIKRFVKE